MSHVERHARRRRTTWLACAFACCLASVPFAQEPSEAARTKTLDSLLDLYVRNGDVYYRAIKSERARLDSYVGQLATASIDKLSRDEQLAFWLNAYNAIVLRTVADHYPLQGHATQYPAKSIRQEARHAASAGRMPPLAMGPQSNGTAIKAVQLRRFYTRVGRPVFTRAR